MIEYLIKSSLCLLVIWGFYKIFLEKENIHSLKRYYLLCAVIFSFTIPLLTFTYQVDIVLDPQTTNIAIPQEIVITSYDKPQESETSSLGILWFIYGIGVLVFGIRFIKNIYKIIAQIKNNEFHKEPTHTNVLLDKKIVPHTFLSYIFFPKDDFKNNLIPDEVLHHEKAHVSQKHTLDILFVELMQVAFWFNPLFIFLKKSIKLNHEFLADQHVLKKDFSIQNYFHILVNYPSSTNQTELSSPINYSLTKKRLQMMTKEFSKKRVVLKLMSFIPIVISCLFFFTNDIIAKEKIVESTETVLVDTTAELPKIDTKPKTTATKAALGAIKIPKSSYLVQEKPQEKVTKQMLDEYNNWAKKMTSENGMVIKLKELQKMKAIYGMMTSDQKAKTEKFPKLPPAPPSPKIRKGEKSNIPPPAPEVLEGEKSNIPPPPPVPSKSDSNQNHTEITFSEEININDPEPSERIEVILEEEEINVQELAQQVREEAELQREIAGSLREEARLVAEEAREEAELQREMAESIREEAKIVAEEARAIAMEASLIKSEEQHAISNKAAKLAKRNRESAQKMRITAMELAEQSQKRALEKRARSMEHAHQAREEAEEKSQKARERKSSLPKPPKSPKSPIKLILEMNEKGASFYHKKKQISFEQAMQLTKTSKKRLSIDARTENGVSKVILK